MEMSRRKRGEATNPVDFYYSGPKSYDDLLERHFAESMNGPTDGVDVVDHKTPKPKPSNGLQTFSLTDFYGSRTYSETLLRGSRIPARRPFLELDALDFQEDFYLSLLDWHPARPLLAVGLGRGVYLYDLEGRVARALFGTDDGARAPLVTSVHFLRSADDRLAVGFEDGRVEVWDVDRLARLLLLQSDMSLRIGVMTSSTLMADLLWLGSRSGDIYGIDVRHKSFICRLPRLDRDPLGMGGDHHVEDELQQQGHYQEICGLDLNRHQPLLASGGNDNLVNIWDLRRLGDVARLAGSAVQAVLPLTTLREHRAAVKGLKWHPVRPGILATGGGSQDHQICLWNLSVSMTDHGRLAYSAVDRRHLISRIDAKAQICKLDWLKRVVPVGGSQQASPGDNLDYDLIVAHGYSSFELAIYKTTPSLVKLHACVPHPPMHRVLQMALYDNPCDGSFNDPFVSSAPLAVASSSSSASEAASLPSTLASSLALRNSVVATCAPDKVLKLWKLEAYSNL